MIDRGATTLRMLWELKINKNLTQKYFYIENYSQWPLQPLSNEGLEQTFFFCTTHKKKHIQNFCYY